MDARLYAPPLGPTTYTIGHGRRSTDELIECLREVDARTLVDVRRFPGSRRNPQFNRDSLAAGVEAAGIAYWHAAALGGLRSSEPGEDRFACLGAFASYVARMGTEEWQAALDDALAHPAPVLMCAETPWQRCHRRWISELLTARGHDVVHLIRPRERERHRLHRDAEIRGGRLYVCGSPVEAG
jgi:uncharacterized protein (DUF488 family)